MSEYTDQLKTMAFWRREEAKKQPVGSLARKSLLKSARDLEKIAKQRIDAGVER